MGREEKLLEVLPPLDWEKVGGETWEDVTDCISKHGTNKVIKSLVLDQGENRYKTWEMIFRTVRQPEWWQGDDKYHAPAYTEPVSALERGTQGWRICCRLRDRASIEHVHEKIDREYQSRQAVCHRNQLYR